MNFIYGPDQKRKETDLYDISNPSSPTQIYKRFYSGNYEKTLDANGNPTEITYIYCAGTLAAMAVTQSGVTTLNYTLTDHLGSILTLQDNNGNITRQSFDAWGNYRNPNDLSYQNIPTNPSWLYRGFTGQEHLPQFGLINMNARLYDPAIGRMLGPDNYVQDPLNSQSFNRYSYCLNNPLKYRDPSGHIWFLATAAIGAVIGGVANVVTNWSYIHTPGQFLAYFGLGAVTGAVIGSGFGALAGVAIASGVLAGGDAALQGQSAGNILYQSLIGAAAGLGGGVFGKYFSGLLPSITNSIVNTVVRGAVTGGVGGFVGTLITSGLLGNNYKVMLKQACMGFVFGAAIGVATQFSTEARANAANQEQQQLEQESDNANYQDQGGLNNDENNSASANTNAAYQQMQQNWYNTISQYNGQIIVSDMPTVNSPYGDYQVISADGTETIASFAPIPGGYTINTFTFPVYQMNSTPLIIYGPIDGALPQLNPNYMIQQ